MIVHREIQGDPCWIKLGSRISWSELALFWNPSMLDLASSHACPEEVICISQKYRLIRTGYLKIWNRMDWKMDSVPEALTFRIEFLKALQVMIWEINYCCLATWHHILSILLTVYHKDFQKIKQICFNLINFCSNLVTARIFYSYFCLLISRLAYYLWREPSRQLFNTSNTNKFQ